MLNPLLASGAFGFQLFRKGKQLFDAPIVGVVTRRFQGHYHGSNRRDFDTHRRCSPLGAVAELVGIKGGVVSGVFNLESSGVEAPDWRPRHDKQYHEA